MKNGLKKLIDIDIDYKDITKQVFCIAISSKPHIYKDIDKIFNKNKIEYMNYFKNSNAYKTPLSNTLMVDASLYYEKVLGILEKGLSNNDFNEIFDLYKKANKKLYNGIKSIKEVTMHHIIKYISTGIVGNYEFVSTIYMYSLLNDKVMHESVLDYLKFILDELLQLAYYDKTNFRKEVMDSFAKEIKEIREYLGLEKRSYNGEELIDIILNKDTIRYNNSKILTPYEMITSSDIHKIEKIGEIGKYVGSYEGLFKYLKINTGELTKKALFNQADINSIIMNYIYSCKFNSFEEKDRNMFLVSSIYFTSLNKEYNYLKNKYLKTLNEDFIEEINTLQNNLEKSISDAKKASESFKNKQTTLETREKELLKRIKELEKENKRLKNEIEEDKPLKQEVIKLRNIVFEDSISSNIDVDNIQNDEINIDELNRERVIIFGGDISWINNMKERLPKARFVSGDYKNIRLDFINKNSIVYINTKMSHAFYYKIKDILTKTNIDYYYINPYSNIDKSLIDMSKQLNK